MAGHYPPEPDKWNGYDTANAPGRLTTNEPIRPVDEATESVKQLVEYVNVLRKQMAEQDERHAAVVQRYEEDIRRIADIANSAKIAVKY